MNTIYDDSAKIETALPNTRPAPNGKWEGFVRTRMTDGRIRELAVCHMHTGTTDCHGAKSSGTVQRFDNDADALNAALALSKRVLAGEVTPGTLLHGE